MDYLFNFCNIEKNYVHTYLELRNRAKEFYSDINYDKSELVPYINKTSLDVIGSLIPELECLDEITDKSFIDAIMSIPIKGKQLWVPINIALTGKLVGIELKYIPNVLPRRIIMNRLNNLYIYLMQNEE